MNGPDEPRRRFGPAARRAWTGLLWATPGQVDAGLASLATFGAGILAVRELSLGALGAYALLSSAFQMAVQVSSELVFIPGQIIAVDHEPDSRLGMVRHSIPRGTILAILAGIAVPLGVLPLVASVSMAELAPLAISAAVLASLSPIQDHLRSMFHLANHSWVAAVMSATHLAVTVAGLLLLSPSFPLWAPFGALALGNLVSIVVAGLWLLRMRPGACPKPATRQLTSLGGWLLVTGLSKTGMGYAARALLNAVVGTAALGFVEGARVVAQPINVLALGLMAQVGPRLTRAGARRNEEAAHTWRTRFRLLLGLGAVPYIALTAVPWTFNPLAHITPRAYQVTGLTAAMLVAVVVGCLLRPLRAELLGARLQRVVSRVTVTTGLLEIFAIVGGVLIGSYVVPLGAGLSSLVAIILFANRLRKVYAEKALDPAESAVSA